MGKRFKRVAFEKMGLEQHLRKDAEFPREVRWGVSGVWLDDDVISVTFRALAPDDAPRPWDADFDAHILALQWNKTSFRPTRLERASSAQGNQSTVIWVESKS